MKMKLVGLIALIGLNMACADSAANHSATKQDQGGGAPDPAILMQWQQKCYNYMQEKGLLGADGEMPMECYPDGIIHHGGGEPTLSGNDVEFGWKTGKYNCKQISGDANLAAEDVIWLSDGKTAKSSRVIFRIKNTDTNQWVVGKDWTLTCPMYPYQAKEMEGYRVSLDTQSVACMELKQSSWDNGFEYNAMEYIPGTTDAFVLDIGAIKSRFQCECVDCVVPGNVQ